MKMRISRKHVVLIILFLFLLGFAMLLKNILFPTTSSYVPTDPRPTYTVSKNITYCTVDGVHLTADIYYPLLKTSSMPFVLFVHGGGWRIGKKESVLNNAALPTLHALTSNGYVVASINYRLAPQYPFPAQIEDAKCAIRFFRKNAVQYSINSNEFAAWGSSAGGHLVSLIGTAEPSAGWDVGQYTDVSSNVQAVVDWFGPEDLPAMPNNFRDRLGEVEVFRTFNMADILNDSPIIYVSTHTPPFFIGQGEEDSAVPPSQSKEFYNTLEKYGVPVQIQWVQNAGHEFKQISSVPISPSLGQIANAVVQFLNNNLKK